MPGVYHFYPPQLQLLNIISTLGAGILGVGYVMPFIYLLWSLRYGKPAGANPWGAVGLEWQTPSPPPPENFETPPILTEPYAYSPSQADQAPQTPASNVNT